MRARSPAASPSILGMGGGVTVEIGPLPHPPSDNQIAGTSMNVIDRPASGSALRFTAAAAAMHALLVRRADELEGCIEGAAEEAELGSIADAPTAYELLRWPEGKEPGGKG